MQSAIQARASSYNSTSVTSTSGSAETAVAVAEGADTARLTDAGVDVLALPVGERGIDPAALLGGLNARGVRSVLLEGGARLAASFVAADLVDEVVAHIAPALLGAGAPVLGDAGITTMTEALPVTAPLKREALKPSSSVKTGPVENRPWK